MQHDIAAPMMAEGEDDERSFFIPCTCGIVLRGETVEEIGDAMTEHWPQVKERKKPGRKLRVS